MFSLKNFLIRLLTHQAEPPSSSLPLPEKSRQVQRWFAANKQIESALANGDEESLRRWVIHANLLRKQMTESDQKATDFAAEKIRRRVVAVPIPKQAAPQPQKRYTVVSATRATTSCFRLMDRTASNDGWYGEDNVISFRQDGARRIHPNFR